MHELRHWCGSIPSTTPQTEAEAGKEAAPETLSKWQMQRMPNKSHAATEPGLVSTQAITPNHQLLIISFGLSDSKSEPGTWDMVTAWYWHQKHALNLLTTFDHFCMRSFSGEVYPGTSPHLPAPPPNPAVVFSKSWSLSCSRVEPGEGILVAGMTHATAVNKMHRIS